MIRTLARTTAFAFAMAASVSAAAPKKSDGKDAKAAPETKPGFTVKSYVDPGLQYFRAAEEALAKSGQPLNIEMLEGDWFDSKPGFLRKDVAVDVLKGKAITTGTRRLTDKERAIGLRDAVLGYYAAVIIANPKAPIESIDSKKWKKALSPGKPFTWRDIAWNPAPAPQDGTADALAGQVSWSLPDAAYAAFAKPFVQMKAISKSLIDKLPKLGPTMTPIASTYVVSDYQDRIGIYGYNLVLANQIHPLKPVRILQVNGVYPDDKTIADGSYPFSAPVTFVYSAKAEADPNHPVHKILAFLKSEHAIAAAKTRSLVRGM